MWQAAMIVPSSLSSRSFLTNSNITGTSFLNGFSPWIIGIYIYDNIISDKTGSLGSAYHSHTNKNFSIEEREIDEMVFAAFCQRLGFELLLPTRVPSLKSIENRIHTLAGTTLYTPMS